MGRAYTSVLPAEFQVMATQVTNEGEPNYKPLTRQNLGTIGRSVMGSNDMQDIGGEPEVYSDEMDPLAFASQQTAKMVAKLKRETALSQSDDVSKLVDRTNVQYNDVSRDDQVSNVKGMRFTGDPSTVGQAMRYHGDAQFEAGQTLDGADIEATFDRAATGMDKASRSSLAQALSDLGPEALQSLPMGAVAGLNEGVEIAGSGGFAGLVVEATGYVPPRLPTRAKLGKKAMRKMNAKQFAAATRAANRRSAGLRNPSLPAPKKRGIPSAMNREEYARQQAQAKREMPSRALQQKQAQEAAVPSAFVALAAQRHREANANARKPNATSHPSQSNYEDSQGQANTVNAQRGAEAQRQMKMVMDQLRQQLQAVWNQLTPSQQKKAQAALKRMHARWSKMTPMQRQNVVKNFRQQLVVYATRQRQAAQKVTGGQASVFSPAVSSGATASSNGGDTDALQAAADAQNGNQNAQATVAASQFQEQEKARIMAQLTAAWNKATARLTPAQKNQLRNRLIQAQKAWMSMTPAQRRQAIRGFRQQAAMLTKATSLATTGRDVTGAGSGSIYDDSSSYVDDTGMATTGGGDGLMDTYDDITKDSSGYGSEPPINPWIIGGAVTLTAIAGGMLFMSGKAK